MKHNLAELLLQFFLVLIVVTVASIFWTLAILVFLAWQFFQLPMRVIEGFKKWSR